MKLEGRNYAASDIRVTSQKWINMSPEVLHHCYTGNVMDSFILFILE